jgi:hypothetical protein
MEDYNLFINVQLLYFYCLLFLTWLFDRCIKIGVFADGGIYGSYTQTERMFK